MKKLKVAIIGQGRSGRNIHGAYFRSEANTHYEVAAVVDALPERRARAAEEYGCPVYEKVSDLYPLVNEIDLVVNSTFSYQHAPISMDLLEHGFNVVCEKPFAKSYEEGTRAAKTAARTGKMLAVFQQSRFAPYYTAIREILDSGVLGEMVQASIHFSGFSRRWDWQLDQSYGGGHVRNTGPHPLDQALDLLGFPQDVNVFSRLQRVNSVGDAEDFAKVILTAPGKPLLDVEISTIDAYNRDLYHIHCSRGTLRATYTEIEYRYFDPETAPKHELTLQPIVDERGLPAYCSEKLDWTEKKIRLTGSAFDTAVEKYYQMIYEHLTEGRPLQVTLEQVLCQLRVIDLIHAQNPLDAG